MRVQTEAWQRFIPGVRNYQGKKTLFWNGEKLWEGHGSNGRPLVYDDEERWSWEVIIVLPGVEVIPWNTFYGCYNIKVVIMADTVRRIEDEAFDDCDSLEYIKLSANLEYIGYGAFWSCQSLTSVFIPPSCTNIKDQAFYCCGKLIIFHVPQTTELGDRVIAGTKLIRVSEFEEDDEPGNDENNDQVNACIKNINDDEEYALHRACSSFNPMTDIIYRIMKRQGLKSFKKKNEIGITPVQYLEENPFADTDHQKLVNRYILELMGETV